MGLHMLWRGNMADFWKIHGPNTQKVGLSRMMHLPNSSTNCWISLASAPSVLSNQKKTKNSHHSQTLLSSEKLLCCLDKCATLQLGWLRCGAAGRLTGRCWKPHQEFSLATLHIHLDLLTESRLNWQISSVKPPSKFSWQLWDIWRYTYCIS